MQAVDRQKMYYKCVWMPSRGKAKESNCFTKTRFVSENCVRNFWIEVYYFIGHEEEMLLFSKSDHFFNALSALDLTYRTEQTRVLYVQI